MGMRSQLAVALVGCGKISEKYSEYIAAARGNARIAAVCDLDARRAAEFGHRCGAAAYSSIEEMVDRMGSAIDLYIVLTPSGAHASNACLLAECGAPAILVEKPIALRLEDAEQVIRICDEHSCQLFVVKQWRYSRAVQALRHAYERGRFGKLSLLTSRLRWCRHQRYYDEARWRGTWAHDGGVLTNQACHAIDLLLWFGGEIDSVYSMCARRLASIEAEDTAVAVIRFASGALGALEATTATRPGNLEGSFSVLGEGGSVELAGPSANCVKTWSFEMPEREDEDCHRVGNESRDAMPAHAVYLREVFACVRDRCSGGVTGGEALESLRVIHALYQSDRQNMPVNIRSSNFLLSRLGRPAAREPLFVS
jgi:predicted dehydrogenase